MRIATSVAPAIAPAATRGRKFRAVRQKYNLGSTPYIFSVGTVQPRKNYRMLIRAFAPIAKQFPHNLAIAGGKGWLFDEILAEIEAQRAEPLRALHERAFGRGDV